MRTLLRAVIRCECQGCSSHSRNRCRHTSASRVHKSRHPIVLHRIGDRTLCHICLNRQLEIQRRRLYADVIPLQAGAY